CEPRTVRPPRPSRIHAAAWVIPSAGAPPTRMSWKPHRTWSRASNAAARNWLGTIAGVDEAAGEAVLVVVDARWPGSALVHEPELGAGGQHDFHVIQSVHEDERGGCVPGDERAHEPPVVTPEGALADERLECAIRVEAKLGVLDGFGFAGNVGGCDQAIG